MTQDVKRRNTSVCVYNKYAKRFPRSIVSCQEKVYMYVYMYVFEHICTYATRFSNSSPPIYIYIYMCVCVYIYTHIYTNIIGMQEKTYICLYICIYAYMDVSMDTHT
jgi:hypothetical protein